VEPFGFGFDWRDDVIVSDAASAALTSYEMEEECEIALITPALGDTQSAPCWVVLPENRRFAYTAHAGSGTVSSYSVSDNGSLTLLDAIAGSTGSGSAPTDMAFSTGNRFLYVRTGGNDGVAGFRVDADGNLHQLALSVESRRARRERGQIICDANAALTRMRQRRAANSSLPEANRCSNTTRWNHKQIQLESFSADQGR
jgi:6-phosphogluconolactonase (cycloisomerase 2 family)